MTTIALVGPDGAGKTTVARAVVARLAAESRYHYMGVNLDTDPSVLPTTRLVLAVKQWRGGRPDLTAGSRATPEHAGLVHRLGRGLVDMARLAVLASEEWYHQLRVRADERRGFLVIADRDFLCDAYATDVAGPSGGPLAGRIHGWLLRHRYRRPGMILVLDVPIEVLRARRPEDDPGMLERRRWEYRSLADALPGVTIIDGCAMVDEIVERIVRIIAAGGAEDPEAQRLAGPVPQEVEP